MIPNFLNKLVEQAHKTAVAKGWWPSVRVEDVPKLLCLIHSEVSEALEDFRKGNSLYLIYMEGDKPCGFPIELADICIRVFDVCGAFGIDIDSAIAMKMQYNETRPFRHGGKAA